jgi:membrane glycosyltransferase
VPWLAPVLLGLTVAIPFARITSSTALGDGARRYGLFLIPEETTPPPELEAAAQPWPVRESPFFEQPAYREDFGLLQAILDPYMHAVHLSLLRLRDQVSERTREYTEELRSKLLAQGPGSLTADERNNLLWDAEALTALHRDLWICPQGKLHTWWEQALRHYSEATAIATRRTLRP